MNIWKLRKNAQHWPRAIDKKSGEKDLFSNKFVCSMKLYRNRSTQPDLRRKFPEKTGPDLVKFLKNLIPAREISPQDSRAPLMASVSDKFMFFLN